MEKARPLPAIVISSCQGHSGKSLISIGLCAALTQKGIRVQPFKKGPDYIDPSWLSAAAGRPCYNLDAFLMPERAILNTFYQACQDADLAVIEGVMGLYDSIDPDGYGSTAWIARFLRIPVILIVNAYKMSRSVAAMIKGYQQFEPETRISGVILNNVSLSSHKKKLTRAIERYCDIPVLGFIPTDPDLNLDEQHLGLRPYLATENGALLIEHIREGIKSCLDLNLVLDIAKKSWAYRIPMDKPVKKAPSVQIGVVLDKAFNFYYASNLETLHQAGAELVFINSLQDRGLPEVDGLYIGGGFPELFAEEIEANKGLKKDIAQAIKDGLPVYAECGGLMYLCRSILWKNRQYEMVGVIPAEVDICPKPQGHGYVVAEVVKENPWFPIGLNIRGHQFHHSRICNAGNLNFVYYLKRSHEEGNRWDGIIYKNMFATYTHLHASGIPHWVESFILLALKRQARKLSAISAI